MIFAIDIDGCLADFNRGYGELFPRLRFAYQDPAFPPVWHWPEHYGATEPEVAAAWSHIKNSKQFWEELQALPQAEQALERLLWMRARGHEIYFLTTRLGKDCKGQTWRWLKTHGYSDPTIVIGNPNEPEAKGLFCRAVGADAIIDDRPLNLDSVAMDTAAYLVDYEHNRGQAEPVRLYRRVESVSEALNEHPG